MITVKINVDKIDKSKLFKGEKGTYLDLVLFETDKFDNDYIVKQSLTKEERESGKKAEILGNGKNYNKPQATNSPQSEEDDSLPF